MSFRERLRRFVEDERFQRAIIALIVFNAVTLGLETSVAVRAQVGGLLLAVDRIVLAIFTVEVAARLAAHGPRFFRDPWNVFDFLVVGVSLLPATEALTVLRALRILRALRLISAVPRMRAVVQGLLGAIPGVGAIVALLGLVYYVAAVMATKMFGTDFPELFGHLGRSLFTLFQIMTLEGWVDGVVEPIMEVYPYAWTFFIPYILIVTFTILNLFIAVIVGAMQAEHDKAAEAETAAAQDERMLILEELRALRREVAELRRPEAKG
jgi:voltage-gated sodium channel